MLALLRFQLLILVLAGFLGCQGRSKAPAVDWRPMEIVRQGEAFQLPCQLSNNTDETIRVAGFGVTTIKTSMPDIQISWNNGQDQIGSRRKSVGQYATSEHFDLAPGERHIHTFTFKDYAASKSFRLSAAVFVNGQAEALDLPAINVAINSD